MLLECHRKHLKGFNLTHYEHAAVDIAEQKTIVDRLYVATGRIHGTINGCAAPRVNDSRALDFQCLTLLSASSATFCKNQLNRMINT